MFDYSALLGYGSIALVVIGAIGYLLTGRSRPAVTEPAETLTPVSDWKPTSKIDFGCADVITDENVPMRLFLRSEEYRVLQSMSGTKRIELRWRDATLAEAKRLVVRHNAGAMAFDRELPEFVSPGIVAEAGVNETSISQPLH